MYRAWYISCEEDPVPETPKKIAASFYQNAAGTEPVRDWLKGLGEEDRRIIGYDIATVEYGWPIGMPTCRPMGDGLFEVRSNVMGKRIARVLFCTAEGRLILLHGFIKKAQKTPKADLDLAKARMKEIAG
jgi:phage-related protein